MSSGAGLDDLFVIEADESDKSFLLYDTAVALVTNVDPEHLDFYGSREAFMEAFVEFSRGATEQLIISADDPGAREVIDALEALPAHARPKIRTFGESERADVRVISIDASGPVKFSVEFEGRVLDAQLTVYGRHNALNAVGAFAVLTASLDSPPTRRSRRSRVPAAPSVVSNCMPK